MDNYVLNLDFYALDMDDVDIVLGYPLMDSIGIVNINVLNKFRKIWYKKNKITLYDISLIKQEEPKVTHGNVYARKLGVVLIDTLYEEFVMESEKKML